MICFGGGGSKEDRISVVLVKCRLGMIESESAVIAEIPVFAVLAKS